jgi:2'-5' RNA ligase
VIERTIGVAVAIPEPYAAELQAHRESFGDPLASSIPTHITLLPPTPVPAVDFARIAEHLRKVADAEHPFEIHLRGTGTFHPVSPVVFVSVALGISDCERVEASVRSGPLSRDLSFPYHPHVTVVHDLPQETLLAAFDALADYSVRFPVWGFSLYEHGQDGVWRPHCAFAFGKPVPAANGG